ncbi:MAG: class II SORL domain-containing protein [Mycoplasmoidaceae bacterium]|nr:class II SORL domain-containing protein [Mycoplasmoidaceae bacterium]
MKFYKRDVCDRFVFLSEKETFEPKCCGKPMRMLKEKTEFDEKHTPVMTTKDNQIIINVGKVTHPMDVKHRIE